MLKNIQLAIPKPCHENWEAMSTVEKGKYCGSCQKQVIDFTNMSDRQLAEFFKKPSTGSLCGRFMTDQLERKLTIPKKRLPWLQYFFTVAIPAFFISKIAAQQGPKIVGKIAYRPVKDTVKLTTIQPVIKLGEVSSTILPVNTNKATSNNNLPICKEVVNATIHGKIIDENGQPIPNATLLFNTRGNTIVADKKGEFVFPERWLTHGGAITFSAVNFTTKSINVESIKQRRMVIKMITALPLSIPQITMGIIAYVEPSSNPTKNETVSIPKKNIVQQPSLLFSITIYPNPVINGSNVNFNLSGANEGFYQLQILSLQGQTVYRKKIWNDKAAKKSSITLPTMAAGTYILQLTQIKSGERAADKMVVL
ncbi:MAG: hypothetical protein RIR12_1864 [Bacteroidota bacterium]|jgi:hypothetical protein